MGTLPKIVEDDHLRASRRFLTTEVEAHRLAVLDHDHVRGVATLDQDHRLLVATRGERRTLSTFAWSPEEPGNTYHQRQSSEKNQKIGECHGCVSFDCCVSFGCHLRKRLALVTTVTELAAIAAAAISGLSSNPVKG